MPSFQLTMAVRVQFFILKNNSPSPPCLDSPTPGQEAFRRIYEVDCIVISSSWKQVQENMTIVIASAYYA
jgi:hypothetical protein